MRVFLPKTLIAILLLIFITVYAIYTPKVKADQALHIVISEVKTAGTKTTDEFVELYNPTNQAVDISGWKLTRKTSGGTESNLASSLTGIIQSHGYYLIAHPDYSELSNPDFSYDENNSITSNNTVILYNNQNAVIDKVGFGSASDFEGSSETDPASGTSRERKALQTSTSTTMGIGGDDEFQGNGEDTDNNSDDFVLRSTPQPQNSNSGVEPQSLPTPTETPTDTPTPTDDPTTTPTQTITPSPTISTTPSVTPTDIPSQTPTPTPIASFTKFNIVCFTKTIKYKIFSSEMYIPYLTCKVEHH